MPRLETQTIGGGDQSWLGSTHGIYNCRSVVIDASEFTAETHYPDGYLPAGTPLTISDEVAGPFDGSTLSGFLYTDQKVGDEYTINGPLFEHGKVRISNLPLDYPDALEEFSGDSGLIIFVDGSDEGGS